LDAAEPLLRRARAISLEMDDGELLDEIDRTLARLWAARQAS